MISRYVSKHRKASQLMGNRPLRLASVWRTICTEERSPLIRVDRLNLASIPELSSRLRRPNRRAEKSPWKAMPNDTEHPQTTVWRDCTPFIQKQVLAKYTNRNGTASVEPNIPNLILLDGQPGVGKTALLLQTVAHARSQGALVLFIPDAGSWTNGDGFFAATAVGDAEPSLAGIPAIRFYDRPQEMHHIFKALLQVHRADLDELPCHPELANDETKHCSTLLDLVELGNNLLDDIDSNWRIIPAQAGSVFNHLVAELCSCTSKPTAIVIDNYEAMIGLTCMTNERKERMHANSIRAVSEHFGRGCIEHTASLMKNGFVLLATNSAARTPNWRKSRLRSGLDYPLNEDVLRDPSGQDWLFAFKSRLEHSERGVHLRIPDLSRQEMNVIRGNFLGGKLRKQEEAGDNNMQRLIALAGGRGDILQKILASS